MIIELQQTIIMNSWHYKQVVIQLLDPFVFTN